MKKLLLLVFATMIFGVFVNAQGTTDVETKTTTVKKKRGPVFRATKEQISQVQTMLTEKGTYKGEITGKFNADFRKAIKVFQVGNELRKTGTLNRATLEKMGVELTDKQKTFTVNPASFDTSKNDEPDKPKKERKRSFRPTKKQIIAAQTKLKDDGKFSGEISGKYSKEFRASLKEIQAANDLKKTGKLDEPTLGYLQIDLTKKQMGESSSDKPKRRSFRVNKDQITQAQTMLKDKGAFNGEATGKYSKEFRTAIKGYQAENGLKKKGSLNRATLEKMGIELTDSQKEIPVNPKDFAKVDDGSPKPKRTIFRANKDQIMKVQAMLREKGLYDGKDTGKLSPATRSAIREWQDQNSVKKTGTLNKVTLEAMGVELTDKQKGM